MKQKKTRPAVKKINLPAQRANNGGMVCVYAQYYGKGGMLCIEEVTFTYPA